MASYSKVLLSGSTDGKAIKVTQTATPGEAVHTADAASLDEIWIYAVNSSTLAVKLTLEWGEATAPNGNIEVTVQPKAGLALIVPGLLLTNSLVVTAFADVADVINLYGFVNRITP